MATEAPPPLQNPNSQDSLILYTAPSTFQPQPPPSPPPLSQPSPPSKTPSFGLFSFQKRPPVRVTTEFDSDSSIFFHKLSTKLFDGVAKLKFSFQNNPKGEIGDPQVALITKNLAVHFDVEERNALVKGFVDVGPNLKLKACHDIRVILSTIVDSFVLQLHLTRHLCQLKQNSTKSENCRPELSLLMRNFSFHYHLKEKNTFVEGSIHVSSRLQLRAAYDTNVFHTDIPLIPPT